MAALLWTFCHTSCSDDNEFNTADATVGFAQSEVSVKESKGLFYVPIKVEGELNGPVELDIEVIEDDGSCKKDEHFMVTSTHIILPANKQQVAVEVMAVDDRIINEDRHFQLRLARAQGAKINPSTMASRIILRDNDSNPYERMAGTWLVEATNLMSATGAEPISWTTTLKIVDDENDPMYNYLITMEPWAIWDGSVPEFDENGQVLTHPLTFRYNTSTKLATLDFAFGNEMAHDLMFGTNSEGVNLDHSYILSATAGMSRLNYDATMVGTVSEDFEHITFPSPVYGVLFTEGGSEFTIYLGLNNIKMTLIK